MKIAYISAEISPAAKVGGLADVTLGLSRAIQSLGNQTIVILPKHKSLKLQYLTKLNLIHTNLSVIFAKKNLPYSSLGSKTIRCSSFFYRFHLSQILFWKRKYLRIQRRRPEVCLFFTCSIRIHCKLPPWHRFNSY